MPRLMLEVDDDFKLQHIKLSCTSLSFLIFLLPLSLSLIYIDRDNVFVLPPLLLAPVLTLYCVWWRSNRHAANLDTVVKMFASGFLPGAFIALVVESALTLLFALVCFADQIPAVIASLRLQLSVTESGGAEMPFLPDDGRPELVSYFLASIQKSFGYFVFLFFMAYVIAALVEESIKWGVVRCQCPFRCCLPAFARITPGVTHPMSIVVYVLAGGLGFSTVENIFYTCSSNIVVPDLSVGEKFLNCMERVLFAVPVHSICAGLTGVQLIRKEFIGDVQWIMVLVPAILVHGTFDFQSFLVTALVENEMVHLCFTSINCAVVLVGSWWYLWYSISQIRFDITEEEPVEQEGPQYIGLEDGFVVAEVLSYTDRQEIGKRTKSHRTKSHRIHPTTT